MPPPQQKPNCGVWNVFHEATITSNARPQPLLVCVNSTETEPEGFFFFMIPLTLFENVTASYRMKEEGAANNAKRNINCVLECQMPWDNYNGISPGNTQPWMCRLFLSKPCWVINKHVLADIVLRIRTKECLQLGHAGGDDSTEISV